MKFLSFLLFIVVCDGAFGQLPFENLKKSNEKNPRFFKAQRVTTFTDYSFSTKTIYPQCVSSVSTVLCSGKKRRKRMTNMDDIPKDNSRSDLTVVEGTLADSEKKVEIPPAESDREGRLAFTVWTTTRTTSTATVKYTNTSTTLSLFYACTVGNVEFPSQFSCITG
ncbi:hypothetical protein Avbf_03251 [Armadillidium vulgare]|nr:hypothetical protein Avbf_03251 [Armadillidium vulgare]